MSTIYRLQFLLIAAAAILATAFPANAQTTLEAVKQKGVLVAGSSAEYPPFEYVADGKLVGYDVDMAEEITRRMGVKVAWEKIDFKGIVAALTAKRVDALITALTWTPERAERRQGIAGCDKPPPARSQGQRLSRRAGNEMVRPQPITR